ncbi:MAG: ATP-binding cassette domain-containing protein [Microthrixaceae bacterium]
MSVPTPDVRPRAAVPPSPVPPVAVRNVSMWFKGLVAVSDVSFDIWPGVTAVLGPNGAGKSTLLRMLCGLAPPDLGTVRLHGVDPRARTEVLATVGLVPQQEGIFPRMTARRFVTLAATLCGLDDPDASARRALATVEMDPDDTRPVDSYSKGMRQRVKVAQALVNDPSIIVADEPLNGLDPRQRLRMVDLFRALGAEGRTVVVSSHVLDEVERFGSRVLVMAQGRLAAEGDFHGIRALMDDRPHLLRLRADRVRTRLDVARVGAGARSDLARRPDRAGRGGLRRPFPFPDRAHRRTGRRAVARGHPARRRPGERVSVPGRCRTGVGGPFVTELTILSRTILSVVCTRARIVGFVLVGVVEVVVAVVVSSGVDTVDRFGLMLLIPIAALVFGTASMGDAIEDGTYVYLWLRPIRRWRITVAAYLVTLAMVVPMAVLPTVVAAGVAGDTRLLGAAVLAASAAAVAYSALFVLLGQLTQRALIWGICYLLIWEQFIARGGKGLGLLSVHSHAASLLARTMGMTRMTLAYYSRPVSFAVLVVGAWCLVALSALRQRSMIVA